MHVHNISEIPQACRPGSESWLCHSPALGNSISKVRVILLTSIWLFYGSELMNIWAGHVVGHQQISYY